jgi:hypothetical protein
MISDLSSVTALWGPSFFRSTHQSPAWLAVMFAALMEREAISRGRSQCSPRAFFKRSDFAAVSTDGGADRMELENCVADFADRHGSPAINRRHPKKFWRGYIQHGWCCGRFGGNGTWAGLMFISGYAVAQT